jgi:1-acyl-sn-glycerol-3-phosphate acyltransferase
VYPLTAAVPKPTFARPPDLRYFPRTVADAAPAKPRRKLIAEREPTPVDVLERSLVVRGGKRFVRAFTSRYHDLRVFTPCPIPERGGAILASNHTSSLDPLPLQAACPRLITWMMAREYANILGLRWFLRAIEPILVERSGRDMAATRAALRALKDGKILGLFPEGRIEKTHDLLEFQTGVALLAMKARVPVYPAYLDGDQRRKGMVEALLVPQRMTLAFGPAVDIDYDAEGREGLEAQSTKIRDAVAALASIGK